MSILVRKNKKAGPSGRSKSKKGNTGSSLLKDSRLPKLLGATIALIGIFILVSGISYVFTWKIDQDKILNYPFSALGEGDLIVSNWLGRLGAVVGNALIYWGFGLTSLVLPILMIGFGLRKLVSASLEMWYTRAAKSFLAMVYCSILFGFLFSSFNFPWGGAFGESTSLWLSKFMGSTGVVLALLFIMFATIIIQFNPSFKVKGEFLAMPDVKVPEWKISAGDLGMDFFKKKKISVPEQEDEIEEEPDENLTGEIPEKKEVLRPGFLERFMKSISGLTETPDTTAQPTVTDEEIEEETEIDEEETEMDLDAELNDIEDDDETEDPELEIISDPSEIAEAFSESHIPPTFSGVQDKVFLMDQENSEHSEPYDPTLELSSYKAPELEMLLE